MISEIQVSLVSHVNQETFQTVILTKIMSQFRLDVKVYLFFRTLKVRVDRFVNPAEQDEVILEEADGQSFT